MYKIIYLPAVIKTDLPKLNKPTQIKIITQIKKKLSTYPEQYGKPLQGILKGFYRLRIENYRVIYEIYNQTVTVQILKIGPRKDNQVYKTIKN
jgi:mRNA interferase RelE/StbE